MANAPITLSHDDPVIFASCSGPCNRSYPGKKVGSYYAKAYTERRWKRKPTCENCGSPMKHLYEIDRE